MKIETSKLEGAALDWAVAQIDPQCEGLEWSIPVEGMPMVGYGEIDGRKEPCAYLAHGCLLRRKMRMRRDGVMAYAPGTDWSQGGRLIGERGMTFHLPFGWGDDDPHYVATLAGESIARNGRGPTHLIAAMRALVMVELGEVVDVPDELVEVPA